MKRILIVDDNKSVTDLAELILKSAGYSCTKVHGGRQCIEAVRESYRNNNKYDLILLDVAMPEYSGIDVLEAMRREGYLNHNRVVFFTASSATNFEMEDFKKLGALDCLKKPFSKAELLNFVAKYVF